MTSSFKISLEKLEEIKEYYKDYQIENNNDLVLYQFKYNNCNIMVYKSLSVVINGKDTLEEVKKWKENSYKIIEHIGSDEVGCGDFFGPVVVSSAYVKEEDFELLESLGVNDSKKISDKTILQIAPIIIEKIKTVTFTLTINKYNELVAKGYNLNKIKAYLHNFVLEKIVSKNNFEGLIVVDQFCEERLYYQYLLDYKTKNIQKDIFFTTKAESQYLAVACASIVARYTFLKEIEKLSQELGYLIPLGAGKEVNEFAIKIAKEKGLDSLKKYSKHHFKNTNIVLEELNDKIL